MHQQSITPKLVRPPKAPFRRVRRPYNMNGAKTMTNKQRQKNQLRVSEIKQRLDIISGYEGDGPPPTFFGKQPPEVVALTTELKDLEWRLAG